MSKKKVLFLLCFIILTIQRAWQRWKFWAWKVNFRKEQDAWKVVELEFLEFDAIDFLRAA